MLLQTRIMDLTGHRHLLLLGTITCRLEDRVTLLHWPRHPQFTRRNNSRVRICMVDTNQCSNRCSQHRPRNRQDTCSRLRVISTGRTQWPSQASISICSLNTQWARLFLVVDLLITQLHLGVNQTLVHITWLHRLITDRPLQAITPK